MKAKVLIVDDDSVNRATFRSFLAEDGYELHNAVNGVEALVKIRTLQPDLVLLDLMMPEMDGLEVCRRVRRDPIISEVPIILITAMTDYESRLEGLRSGADDFLTKPCRSEELRARVRTVTSLNRFRTIADQRERFERLYELSPAAIVLANAQGMVLAANPPAESLLADSDRPLREGQPLVSRFEGAAAEIVKGVLEESLSEGGSPARELRRRTADGEQVMHVRASAVPEGDLHRVMFIFDDITEIVRAREDLQKANAGLEDQVQARTAQLEEANGLLMSYASFVSHDLRSPLSLMKGYLSLLKEGLVPLGSEAAPMVAQAYEAALMMEELIHNILRMALDSRDGLVPSVPADFVDPAPIIRRVVAHALSHQSPQVTDVVIGPLVPVAANPALIERVFHNLVSNALKYSGGVENPRVEIGMTAETAIPTFFVRDNGIGFDARDGDRLFQEFSRLPTVGKVEGLGLGLSLVARLVKAHRGRLWAEGTVGGGATFYVQLGPVPGAVPAA